MILLYPNFSINGLPHTQQKKKPKLGPQSLSNKHIFFVTKMLTIPQLYVYVLQLYNQQLIVIWKFLTSNVLVPDFIWYCSFDAQTCMMSLFGCT